MIDREILCLGHQTAERVLYTGTAWRMEERMEERSATEGWGGVRRSGRKMGRWARRAGRGSSGVSSPKQDARGYTACSRMA